MNVDSKCLFCDEDESINHVMLDCVFAELWRLTGIILSNKIFSF